MGTKSKSRFMDAPPSPENRTYDPIMSWILVSLLSAALIGAVFLAVHHAEVVAHRVGEPYGTLVLAVAIPVIAAALIASLPIAGGPAAAALARDMTAAAPAPAALAGDTVCAAVMLILNGIVGACLLVGGTRHREQEFGL